MIIWLIGISGAGKTTLGRKLENFYKNKGLFLFFVYGCFVCSKPDIY